MSKGFFVHIPAIAILMFGSATAVAQTSTWTLESSAQRILQVAPERGAAEAEVNLRQGRLSQAGVWPNPTFELGASNAMGKDDGKGGTDINLFSITQPLPLSGRLGLQRKQADAQLNQAEAALSQQGLSLEYEAARVFHNLQFSRAQLKLAEQQLESANEFQHIGRRREQAGDLSRLARLRLDLVRESATQKAAASEGQFNEALSDFRTRLNLADANPTLHSLQQFPELPVLADIETGLDTHPTLMAAQQEVNAAHLGVAVARRQRFADPEIWVARERDVLGDKRQDATAFGIAVTLPLWDRSKGEINAAQANKKRAQLEVTARQRELGNRLRLSHLHLSHLIEQGKNYQTHVLEPAEEIFQLSRKGFAAGQVEILNLVDAVDTYFEARIRYLEFLKDAWLEAAALRRAAGLSLLTHKGTAQ